MAKIAIKTPSPAATNIGIRSAIERDTKCAHVATKAPPNNAPSG